MLVRTGEVYLFHKIQFGVLNLKTFQGKVNNVIFIKKQ